LTSQLQRPAPPITDAELAELRALIPPGFQSRWLAGRSIMTHELAVRYLEDVPRLIAEIYRLRRLQGHGSRWLTTGPPKKRRPSVLRLLCSLLFGSTK